MTIAAIIAEALRGIGQDPILVGGSAVEFYSQGGYSTADIDLVAEGGPGLTEIMKELDFHKFGKDFVNQKLKIYVEFPSPSLKPQENFQKIKVGDKTLSIISVEDLIVDRLNAFKFWGSAIDGINAMLLLEMGSFEESHLEIRAQQEEVLDALQGVREVREEIIRKKMSRDQGNQLLLKKMKALK